MSNKFAWTGDDLTLVDDPGENWEVEDETLEKIDEYHDSKGRFAAAPGGGAAVREEDAQVEPGPNQPFETMPKPRAAPALKDWGNPKGPMNDTGGSYRRVIANANPGEEIHHMPADSSSPLNPANGPAIAMPKEDHMLTASYGTSASEIRYRQEQRRLISQGKFLEAQQMDIDDLHAKFGDKYDKQIEEMKNYTSSLRFRKGSNIPLNPTPAVIRAKKA